MRRDEVMEVKCSKGRDFHHTQFQVFRVTYWIPNVDGNFD